MRVCQFRHIRIKVGLPIVQEQARRCQCAAQLRWPTHRLEAEAEIDFQTPVGRLATAPTAAFATRKR